VEVKINDAVYKLSFLIEPYIPDAKTVSEYLQTLLPLDKEVDSRALEHALHEFTIVLHQWITAIRYLHDKKLLYLDIKPENALIDREGHLAVIDFGSVKRYEEVSDRTNVSAKPQATGYFESFTISPSTEPEHKIDEGTTDVYFTHRYAHPEIRELGKWTDESRNRVKAGLKRKVLHPRFDHYSFGKSILELLNQIAQRRPSICPQLISFRYLNLLATRLLDGYNQDSSDPNLYAKEIFRGLRHDDYSTIKYNNLDQVLQDIEKELGWWNPEIKIPELETYSKNMVRVVPNTNTVMSERLRAIIEHPLFARLKFTTELGLITLIYPTADHSRFDHILGTYTYVGAYVKSLFNDRQNPIFRNLVDEKDIKGVLLAALFHDLGQYPLAHDLEEVCRGIFDHSRISQELLDYQTQDLKKRTLSDLINDPVDGWGVRPQWVKQILGAHSHSTLDEEREEDKIQNFKVDMLSALIDGPIDADKADYIVRDTTSCRIPYGMQMDIERLLRVLTVAIISDSTALHRVTIGVYEKGQAAAESFGFARHLLYAAVYWHHTFRVIKAMLQHAVAMELPDEVFPESASEDNLTKSIRSKVVSFVIGMVPPFDRRPNMAVGFDKFSAEPKGIPLNKQPPNQVLEALESSKEEKKKPVDNWYPGISWTDWLMLSWLKRELPKPNNKSSMLIDGIMNRTLYKRLAIWDRAHNSDLVTKLERYHSWPDRIALCKKLQGRLDEEVRKSYKASGTDTEKDKVEVYRLFDENLGVLIDIPDVKKIGFESSRPLTFVPELKEKTYYQSTEGSAESESWSKTVASLMDSIASIRILCHPDLVEPISKSFQPKPVDREIKRILLEIS
jgi:HD superfamily phosphohydrolase